MRTAVIGLGVIGKVHSKVLMMQNRNIVAFCDIDRAAAERAAAEFAPEAEIYVDWREMLDRCKPDVVHICTPHYLHAEMVIEILGRNINALCEKPLCINEDQLEAVLRAEKASKAKLGVCQQNRYRFSNVYTKNYLKDKEILTAHGSVVWHRAEEYYNSAAWRGTVDREGGGVLINQALHTLDLLEWFCGEPEYALAKADNLSLKGVIEVEDTLSAVYSGKSNFSIFATNASKDNMPVEVSIKLKSGEFIKVLPNMVIIDGEVITENSSYPLLGKLCYGNGHDPLISDFYRCIAENDDFPINGEEGAKVIKLILAAYRSKGDVVRV